MKGGRPPTLPEGEGREIIQAKCVSCHDAQRVIRVRADRNRWSQIIQNMRAYSQGSTLAKDLTDREAQLLLDYMGTNYGPSARAAARPKPDPNSRLPRVLMTGDAMKYMAVEYELPNNRAEPHEVTVDGDGNGAGFYRIPGFGKDIAPNNVNVSCAKDGYKQTKVLVKTAAAKKPVTAIEIECTMQTVGVK